MSNIFNNIFKNRGQKEVSHFSDCYQTRQTDTGKGLIVMGYSTVFYDLHPKTRINNHNNL